MPPTQPPPTPWLPNSRFTDQSLLIEAHPIFDDSLDNDSSWVGQSTILVDEPTPTLPSRVHKSAKHIEAAETTFDDLMGYLPDEIELTGLALDAPPMRHIEPSRPIRAISEISSSALSTSTQLSDSTAATGGSESLKREGSQTSHTTRALKRVRHSKQGSDDFFSRRLSDSDRRLSSARAIPLVTIPVKDSSSIPSESQASGSAPLDLSMPLANQASKGDVVSKTRICEETTGATEKKGREGKTVSQTGTRSKRGASKKGSALSRYLARSAALASKNSPVDDTDIAPSVILSSTTMDKRRTSMGEKVVGFISDLLHPSEPLKPTTTVSSPVDNPLKQTNSQSLEKLSKPSQEGEPSRPSSIEPLPSVNKAPASGIAPLTKPIPFSRPLHLRPSQISQSEIRKEKAEKPYARPAHSRQPLRLRTEGNATKPKTIDPVKSHHPLRAPISSSFASAAVARLPPPGKGHKVAIEPVKIREAERKQDIASVRGVFERLASSSASSSVPKAGTTAPHVLPRPRSNRASNFQPTIPLRGHTPGKSSALRAQKRAEFDQAVKEKMEEKERREEKERKAREAQEETEYMQRRKETVIWAKPVPALYRAGKEH